jgi:signal transduction histidine kinase/ActR/RegA family two-component response regulator
MRRFVYLFFCSIFVVLIPGLLAASNRTVKVGIYQNKPKVFIDSAGIPQGFFIDILNHIASKEGWQLDYVSSTWEKNLEKLKKAEIDLILDIAQSEERAELFDFNEEIIFSNWAIVYVQKHSKIQSILDLRGKKIAAVKGDISYEDFSGNLGNLGIYARFVEVDEFSDVFELIAQEKVDAGIISRLYGLQHENKFKVARSNILCCPRNLYFAVPKNKNQDLIKKIDQHLYQLKRDDLSLYYRSLIKWIEGISPFKFPAWLAWLMILTGATLAVFAAGIVVLKNKVNLRTTELRKRNEELINEIVDRKQAQVENEMLPVQLIQAQKMEAIGTLAGGIAHDFNNSLQAITSYVQLMKVEKARDSQDSDYLIKMSNIIKNANKLTKQLLTVSRKIESKLQPTNLNDQILQVQLLLERTIPKMIKIELDLGKNLKIIHADSGQIEQVLLNLALNASHAMPDEGKITIKTRNFKLEKDIHTANWGTDRGEYVLLNISDTGHGIEKEVLHRMFEPFYTTKAPGQGTGLGLSVVYGIIKNHHGHIECDSEPGAGTCFSVYFPVSKSENMLKDEMSTEKEKIATGNETILLIEDDESIRDAAKRMLTHFGYTVIPATNAEKAIEIYLAEQESIELVILALNIPGMGGRKCLERLVDIQPELKTIVTSGYPSAANLKNVHNAGNAVIVEKPYQFSDLLRTIRQVLDKQP